uniref:Uncharacterized protein n=1 Tax=Candidatus Nitrotoga fabula TaxID=2182327 RepID=A0A2X0R3V6_9PROT|nr:protein of unknown function [Candidatus Nitrotoga fabula]
MVQEYRGEYPSLWGVTESIAPRISINKNTNGLIPSCF